jgi:hypothetical protein
MSMIGAKAGDWYEGLLKTIFSLEDSPQRCAIALESKNFGIEIRQLLYGKKKYSSGNITWKEDS